MGDDAAAASPRRGLQRQAGKESRSLRSVLIGSGDAQLPDTNELGSD